MATWIELHTNLPRHPKAMQLQELLHLKMAPVIGHLCLLWMWALENTPDGRLQRLDAKALARICQFPPRRADELLEALLTCGFLDQGDDGLRLHDWESYAGRYNEQRRKDLERKRRYRERLRSGTGTGTSADVPPLPDQTIPNQTLPDRTIPDQIDPSSGAGGGGAPGRTQADFLDSQGLQSLAYEQADEERRRFSDRLTEELFATFCTHAPTRLDRIRVFTVLDKPTEGGESVEDSNSCDLLRYAFQQAAQAGRPGVWPYIEAVLGRMHGRGIRDLAGAEAYDLERSGL